MTAENSEHRGTTLTRPPACLPTHAVATKILVDIVGPALIHPKITTRNAVPQGRQVERVLLAIPGQAPTKERGKDRLLCAKASRGPG